MKTTNATTQADVKVKNAAAEVKVKSVASEPALVKKEIINKVSITGHLGNDPEFAEFTGGMKRAKFRVATNRYFKNKAGEWQSETTWHNVVAWSDKAVAVAQQLKKGTAVSLEGKLNYRMYIDSDGNERFYTEVVVKSIAVAVPAKENEIPAMKIAA